MRALSAASLGERVIPRSRPRDLWLVACITALVMSRALTAGFVADDLWLIARNPVTRDPSNVLRLVTEPMWGFLVPDGYLQPGYWRPLSSVLLMLGWCLGGGGALGLHALCLALHVAAACMAYRLALVLSRSARVALFAGLLFALHPAQVEPVMWVSAISDPLGTLLCLTAAVGFFRWLTTDGHAAAWRCSVWFALALLTKESAVTLPLLLLLVRACVGRRLVRSPNPWPLLLGAAAILGLYFEARILVLGSVLGGGEGVVVDPGAPTLVKSTGLDQPLLMVHKLWLPGLSGSVAPSIALVFAVAWLGAALLVWRRRRARLPLAGIAWLVVGVLPMVLMRDSIAGDKGEDRFLNLGLWGFAVSLGALLAPLRWGRIVLVILLGSYAVVSWQASAAWQNQLEFVQFRCVQHPRSVAWHCELARTHLDRASSLGWATPAQTAQLALAQRTYLSTRELLAQERHRLPDPEARWLDTQLELGLGYHDLLAARSESDITRAVQRFRLLAKSHEGDFRVLTGLGVALGLARDLAGAERALRAALRIQPRHAEALFDLGRVLWMQHRPDEALPYLEEALARNPGDPKVRELLDQVHAGLRER
ncbi:MAG: tetratricopeptide repeat protein [Planctomycetes bacterium]|nr:tetratricopeptide repeat protein [Planctomycetota bacterium]